MSTEPAGGTVSGNADTITDRELFDHAVTAPDPSAPAPSGAPPLEPSSQPSGGDPSSAPPSTRPDLQPDGSQPGQPRDPAGRFAPKPQQPPGQQAQQDHRVPLRELMEERDRRQRLEAHTQQLTQAVIALQQQLMPQQQPQQPQGPQTIFDDPETYLEQRVMNPLRQEGQLYIAKVKDDLSREQANQQYGAQEVNAALQDIARIRQTPQGMFIFNQIMGSGHPYGQLVQWHRQARAQAAIGPDPRAWLQQQQQAWADNPKVQDYVMQRRAARLGAQNNPPNVQLPPSLSSARSSSGRVDNGGDLSSASLYDFATK